jgi:hypothetical protein
MRDAKRETTTREKRRRWGSDSTWFGTRVHSLHVMIPWIGSEDFGPTLIDTIEL